jgi:hypothetical protein
MARAKEIEKQIGKNYSNLNREKENENLKKRKRSKDIYEKHSEW